MSAEPRGTVRLRGLVKSFRGPRGPNGAGKSTTIGADDFADQRTQKLSGGQTQRGRFAIEFAARGRTVLFATHYLEEADDYADRAVLMAQGRVVADGPTNEIKALVANRTIRATLPGVELEALRALPGVSGAERRGEAVLVCAGSDRAIRALLQGWPRARDIEIEAAGLEQAFLTLTAAGRT